MKIRFERIHMVPCSVEINFRGILGERVSFQKNFANERLFSPNVM